MIIGFYINKLSFHVNFVNILNIRKSTEFMGKFVVFKYFGTWNEVLNHFENLLM